MLLWLKYCELLPILILKLFEQVMELRLVMVGLERLNIHELHFL